jgi:hypothetical protein
VVAEYDPWLAIQEFLLPSFMVKCGDCVISVNNLVWSADYETVYDAGVITHTFHFGAEDCGPEEEWVSEIEGFGYMSYPCCTLGYQATLVVVIDSDNNVQPCPSTEPEISGTFDITLEFSDTCGNVVTGTMRYPILAC